MSLPNITFIKGQGGLGRPLPGQDYISGLVFYTANGNLPSGVSTNNRIKAFYAVSDAENAGIANDYSDATAATATFTVSAVGVNGDTLKLTVADIDSTGTAQTVDLGTYTKVNADNSTTLVATALAAMINAGTVNHGYSATSNLAVVTISAPKRLGIYLNTGTPLAKQTTGTIDGSIAQFTGGVASNQAIWHYHISEFFRMQPGGVLYVGFFAVPGGAYDFLEITTMQNFANGAIRQIGVMKGSAAAFSSGDFTTMNAVCVANDDAKKPLSSLYAADLSGTADISTIADLSVLSANKVSAVIGQDGGGLGNYLFKTTGKSVTVLGAQLGTVALAKVSESIAWVSKFNISNGSECEVLAFANGKLFSDASITDNLLSSLNDKRYIFLKKFVGLSGSYFNDSHTAITPTSDYAQIENNRTIDKAIRGVYASLLPSLNSPLQLNANGTLSETTLAYFESQAGVNLDVMVRDAEISAFQITINPNQDVLATSKIVIAVTLVINGVARFIEVPIGFKPSIN
jgi:hypothetical protein